MNSILKPLSLAITTAGIAVLLSSCGGSATPAVVGVSVAKTCAEAAAQAADFYVPPNPLPPGQPGDLIRCEDVLTTASALVSATRIMYRSQDIHGNPIAVTGIVLEPSAPWTGAGARPLIGFAIGTHGQGDQCAPSRLLADGGGVQYAPPLDFFGEYEVASILDLLSQGIALAITDYEGLGTPAIHTYLSPVAEAHANIDAVRAAQRLPGTSIPAHGPVGFAGYSQGGNAAAGTAETVGDYAPELDVVGTYAGAPPADIHGLFSYLDGTALVGVMGYFLNGLAAAFPETETILTEKLNAAGQQLRLTTKNECVVETFVRHGTPPQQSSSFTVSGQSIPQMLESDPTLNGILPQFKIGTRRPYAPVLLVIGANDEIVPPDGVRGLAADWCAQGAVVELNVIPLPLIPTTTPLSHFANQPLGQALARGWLRDRFNGVAAPNTCP